MHLVRPWLLVALLASPALGQTVDSGSDGSDGALTFPANAGQIIFQRETQGMFPDGDPTNDRVLDPDGDCVFHFTSVTVPTGTSVRLSAGVFGEGRPIVWLVSGNVSISGNIDLSGESGSSLGGVAGAGGYSGGRGALVIGTTPFAGAPGNGPGGGRTQLASGHGESGGQLGTGPQSYGNDLCQPLIGGSGGAGGGFAGSGGGSAGGGGGALLLAVGGTLEFLNSGYINAIGGNPQPFTSINGGTGSGGMVRLVATRLRATSNSVVYTGTGRVRLEAYSFLNPGFPSTTGSVSRGAPNALFLGPNAPGIRVTTVAGVAVAAEPTGSFFFPDVVVTSPGPASIALTTKGIPAGTVLDLKLMPEVGSVIQVTSTPVVVDGDGNGTATATASFPAGHTRIFARANWTP